MVGKTRQYIYLDFGFKAVDAYGGSLREESATKWSGECETKTAEENLEDSTGRQATPLHPRGGQRRKCYQPNENKNQNDEKKKAIILRTHHHRCKHST